MKLLSIFCLTPITFLNIASTVPDAVYDIGRPYLAVNTCEVSIPGAEGVECQYAELLGDEYIFLLSNDSKIVFDKSACDFVLDYQATCKIGNLVGTTDIELINQNIGE
jgi:hypothetical protein